MKTNGILFAIIAFFFAVADTVYWFTSHEPVGTTCMALTFALGALISYYLLYTQHRLAVTAPQDRSEADISEGAGELGFFSPHSWWPIAIAGSVMLVILGIIFGVWLSIMGVGFLLAAVTGLLFEYVAPEGRGSRISSH